MFTSKLFVRAFILLVIIGILNYIAAVLYLHWTVWWYDVMLHFLSGFCASLAFMHFYFYFFKSNKQNKLKAIHLTFFFVFAVGILWEIFEVWNGDTSFFDGIYYVRDTISDLIIDLCGGFFGTLYSFKFLNGFIDTIE